MEGVEPCSWNTFQTEGQEDTKAFKEENADEISQEASSTEDQAMKKEAAVQDSLDIQEIERIMCSLKMCIRDSRCSAQRRISLARIP